jgi:prepilin-type processing-associated H-X9-DG protein
MWRCPAGGDYFANNLILGDNRYDRSLYRTHWKVSMFSRPSRVPVMTDALPGDFANAAIGGFEGVDFRHAGGAVFLFLDCRVEWIRKSGAKDVEKWWREPVRGQYRPEEPEPAETIQKTENEPEGVPPSDGK